MMVKMIYVCLYITFLACTISEIAIITGNRISDLGSNSGQECVSLCANAFGKGVNPSVLLPTISK